MVKSLHTPQYGHFRALMAALREQAKLPQSELAARLGAPQSFVSKYESGERRLDVIEFIAVCDALGVAPDSILKKLIKTLRA